MWISNLIPEWLWMWGASRLNTALRRQAVERIDRRDREKMKSSDSMNSIAEALQS